MNRRFFSSTSNLLTHLKKSNGKRIVHIFDQQDTEAEKKKNF